MTAGDLSATFINPYSAAVSAPTGSVTFGIPGGSGVSVGTLLSPGSYTMRANYPDDTNYNTTYADVTWTISLPAPVITSPGAMTATVGATATYQTTATNSPTSFSFGWITSVAGPANFNAATGLLQLTPNAGTQGSYSFNVSGTSATGTGPSQTVALTVFGRQPSGGVTNTTPGGATSIIFGQNLSLTWTGSAPDGNLSYITTRLGGPAVIVAKTTNAPANASSFGDSGPWGTGYTWTTAGNASSMTQDITWRPSGAGSFAIRGHVRNSDWSNVFNDGRDFNFNGPTFTVNKATPSVAFASRTTSAQAGTMYTLTVADLNAALANPFSVAVAQPNPVAVTYRFAGTSTAVNVGSVLATGHTYSIEAVYPGDANYNANNTAASFAVAGASAPASVVVPAGGSGSNFVALSWTPSVSPAGIKHYEVYRGPVLIGTSTNANYTDTTAASSTAYTYVVRAVDNSGNVSVLSNPVNATTASSFELFTPL